MENPPPNSHEASQRTNHHDVSFLHIQLVFISVKHVVGDLDKLGAGTQLKGHVKRM